MILLNLYVRDKWVTMGDVQIWSPVIIYQWRTVLSGISLVSYRWQYQTNIHVTANLKSTGRLPILIRSYIKLTNITFLWIPTSLVSIIMLTICTLSQCRCKGFLAPLARFSNYRWRARIPKKSLPLLIMMIGGPDVSGCGYEWWYIGDEGLYRQ
jgi:hypothetical protein